MRRSIKKYQTPGTTLPSILEAGIPTEQDAYNALLEEIKKSRNGIYNDSSYNPINDSYDLGEIEGAVAYSDIQRRPDPLLMEGMLQSTDLLHQAATKAALDDMMIKQDAATEKEFKKSIEIQRAFNSEINRTRGSNKDGDTKGWVPQLDKSTISGLATTVNGVTNAVSPFINTDDNSSFKQQQAFGNMLMQTGNPYAMTAGAIWNTAAAADQALGINLNTLTKEDAAVAGINNAGRLANNIIGFLPGTGAGLLAGKVDDFNYDERLNSLGGSYGNTLNNMKIMEGMSGGRYIAGKDKINNTMRNLNETQVALLDSKKTNTLRMNSDYKLNLNSRNLNQYAGNNYTLSEMGKNGMKLISKEDAKMLLESRKQLSEDVALFKDGGKMNILPEGKLHAHKHHLDEIDERLEDITKKGIPIVTVSENGEMSQVAEVEKEELILHLELTQQIESLWEQYKNAQTSEEKNRIAFECGDLLCREIITNTEDNTNLIKEL